MLKKEKALIILSFLLLILTSVVLYSCKPGTQVVGEEGTTSGGTSNSGNTTKSVISGQVVNNRTGVPIDSATVELVSSTTSTSAITNSQGKYSFTVQLSNNTNYTLYTSKSGYVLDTTNIYVSIGVDYNVSLILLVQQGTGSVVSGEPVSIFLASQTSSNIGVKESGSPETAGLTFEVQDSSGIPLDINHSVKVNFSIGASPGGGEFISPSSVYTNSSGQATVNVTSGTKAGVVQVIAEIDLSGNVIKSKPVNIAIYGGLPDYNHFGISTTLVNFPDPTDIDEWTIYPSAVKVFIGDKYSNPVTPKTVVYYTTTGGYVQGSSLTDQMGTTNADLVVALPFPTDPTLGPGFATIKATTADENNQNISRSATVIFSRDAQITDVSPQTFNIPNGGAQTFSYTVADQYGNPLSSFANISVNVQGVNVAAQGDINFSMPDTKNKNLTHFQFLVFDTVDTVNVANPVVIKINVSGANGSAMSSISGTSH